VGVRALAFDAIARCMPWWPVEKLIEQILRFFTPTSLAIRRAVIEFECLCAR
jgi:hypothetical protein